MKLSLTSTALLSLLLNSVFSNAEITDQQQQGKIDENSYLRKQQGVKPGQKSESNIEENEKLTQDVKFRRELESSCFDPIGLGNGEGGTISFDNIKGLLDGPLPFLFLPLADPLISSLVSGFETPIQFRQAMYHGNVVYNVAAMYHPKALDIFGKKDMQICDNFSSDEEKIVHEQVAIAYTFAYSAITIVPACKPAIDDVMNNFLKLPMSYLDNDVEDLGAPWALARARVDQMTAFAQNDGWNADGSMTNEYNKMPFSDFKLEDYLGYTLSNTRVKNKCDAMWEWEPLLESNGHGYFTRQEHVTPFIGFTGRLYGLSRSEYENFTAPPPEYNYCKESDAVISETKDMANDEQKKVEVEVFDSKFTSLLPMQIEWSLKKGLSSFDFWYYDMTLVTAMYDATMLVWREKVVHNSVRPTTVVHKLKGNDEIDTFAGPYEGSKKIKGFDWQPYIRTMPHAEYPSGSSCICTAFAETMQKLTGSDGTGGIPLVISRKAGTSFTEPGVTPSVDLELTYDKWSKVQNICGVSRLYGGMHFSKAVPAGEELCTGLADLVVHRAELLIEGDTSGALVDLDNTNIEIKSVTRLNSRKQKNAEWSF